MNPRHYSTLMCLVIALTSLTFVLFSQNPIVTENALPGNPPSEWDISGAGDLDIQGFATDISVNKGETIRFKISSVADFTIRIYRLGYYNGDGARLIADLGSFTGQVQAVPAPDPVTGLVDCGQWSESANWAVPATAVSGVYIAKLTRSDNGGASHIVFIVRDDAGTADILFKTADATWQAYNVFGGNSLYVGSTPGFPSGHAPKVSYNRPFITRNGGGGGGASEDWLFNAEYPMIRWLERNGYDVSYFIDIDADRFGNLIQNYQAFLSVGHDEYWSAAERANVEAARDAGVHLAFFSGNEVYWKTRWENSVDGNNTPYRTLVCYKEGTLGENVCGFKCDPEPNIWTGLWRTGCAETNDACMPENALTGQISWIDSDGAITVSDEYKDLRFWRNTSVATLGAGQSVSFTPATIGYEWNPQQAQYADSYPAGRIILSETNLPQGTHHLSLYRHTNGALVFGAGTVQWSWGLDENHDRGSDLPSVDMQQATVNLLADMGVQPGSIQNNLVAASASTDADLPLSTITFPSEGATLTNGATVTITGTASDLGGAVAGVEVSVDGGTTWQVAEGRENWTFNWIPFTNGTVNIQSRAFDDSGNIEIPSSGINVNVETGQINCPCSIWPPSATPATITENDPQAVELGVKFQSSEMGYITGIRFYKGPSNTGTHTGNLWTTGGTNLGTVTFTNETADGWQEALFAAPIAVDANTTYIASYHTTSGNYSVTSPGFTTEVLNPPLKALADGAEGGNGLYTYSGAPAFPTQTFGASNYWVDVVFETEIGPDETPPTVVSNVPATGATGIAVSSDVQAFFNEPIDPATVNSTTFEVLDGSTPIAGTVSYDPGSRSATFDPSADLAYSTTYTARLVGGGSDPRIKDLAGNALAADYTWTFTTGAPPPPPPSEGPGGPILVISSAANPFSRYPVEILRTEGFNAFTAEDISQVTPTVLSNYDVVILGDISLSSADVTNLTDWVNAGGVLIAFSPDPQLASLLGLTPTGGTLSEGYLLVNTSTEPGAGIVGETIQFHGTADLYTLNGATSLATLYSDATTSTNNPAVTTIDVGSNDGKAIAFTYDLARSIVYTRQGNPAWAGQDRDGQPPVRANDMFYGDAAGDPQPDWVNLDKVMIPQADEQQRLLANLIVLNNLANKPLPRFWYLPRGFKAAVVMTGDDHRVAPSTSITSDFFDLFLAESTDNSSQGVANWDAVRGSSYIYPGNTTTDAEAAAYETQGFEIGLHFNTDCVDWDPLTYETNFENQLGQLAAQYPSISRPQTNRTHCIAWSDWSTQPELEAKIGIRLDANYYYWPPEWVQDRPGMFTGSGMPMRFAQEDGTIIDCYQVTTQLTDESGQNIPVHIASLLDKAVGPEGYYGVFCANMHTDRPGSITLAANIIDVAKNRDIPVVSSKQMLDWLDGRNGSSFENISWANSILNFSVDVGTGANNLHAMLPYNAGAEQLISLTLDGAPVNYTLETIKGIEYALFPAAAGDYVATFDEDLNGPVISNITATPGPDGTATITWDTDEPATSQVDYDQVNDPLNQSESDAALVTSHSIELSGLSAATTYYYRVTSTDVASNSTTDPVPPSTLTFTMPAGPCAEDDTDADFNSGTVDANTQVVLEGDGGVVLTPDLNEGFTATSLPLANWDDGTWNAGGSINLSNGVVTVDGARIATKAASPFSPGSSVEFVATFTGGEFQNIGFATDFDFNAPWVTIGTGANVGGIYVRSNSTTDELLTGVTFNTPHLFRINWNATDFEFYVDGNLLYTLPVTIGSDMVVQISDFPVDAFALDVDWIRIGNYPASGVFTSRVFDQGGPADWEIMSWNSREPVGTSITMEVRYGNTPTPDGSWSSFQSITNGASVGANARYIQYQATLSTTNNQFTPVLEDVAIGCVSTPDVTPPVISNVMAVPGGNGTSATITWDTDELATSLVEFGTDPENLTQSVSDGAFVLAHSLEITGLNPLTTYYFQVTSVDAATNTATDPMVYSFTTLSSACFVDQVAADFELGTLSNTYIQVDGDGAIVLAPQEGSEFEGPTDPVGWTTTAWGGGGTTTYANGQATVDGARLNADAFITAPAAGETNVLEFQAAFSATAFQIIGFGGGDNTTTTTGMFNTGPWAAFRTGSTGTSLLASTFLGSIVDVDLGPGNLGVLHTYRIEWQETEIRFYIDDQLVHTESITISADMRIGASDFNAGGNNVVVDWMRLFPYTASGSFESRIFDAGEQKDWQEVNWVENLPAGTSLQIFQRQGNTPIPDGSWTSFSAIPSNGAIIGGTSQYIQYRADLATTDPLVSPVLEAIEFRCAPAPLAAPTVLVDPVSTQICDGSSVSFTSAAQGNPAPGLQWQVSTDGGNQWNDLTGETASPLTFTATLAENAYQYRAVWSNSEGTVNSAAALLIVDNAPGGTLTSINNTLCNGSSIDLVFNADPGTTGPYNLEINEQVYSGIESTIPFNIGYTPLILTRNIWENPIPEPSLQDDGTPLSLGVKFRSSENGWISGIRFYKGWENNGTQVYTVRLYDLSGPPYTPLAIANTTLGDSEKGWQPVYFSSPIQISANTTYIASFETPNAYVATTNYFNTSYQEDGSPLTALADGIDGSNGVFIYSGQPDFPFPSNSFNSANYWVDVLFQPLLARPNYQLTSIEASNGCVSSDNPIAQVDIPVVECPCDLIINGMVLRLESDAGVDLSGNLVNNWIDLSGAGNDLSAFQDPILNNSGGPNGLPFIQLDGISQKLERTATINGLPAGNDDRTVFFVARYNTAPAAAGFVYGNTGTDQAFGLVADGVSGNLAITSGTSDLVSSGSPSNGVGTGWLSQSVVLSSGAYSHYRNGEEIAAGTNTFATDLNKIVIGEDIGGNGFAAIDVAAVLIYDRALSDGERKEVEAYLQNKYFGLVTDNLVLHLEADANVTAANGTVSSWGDQSGSGNDLSSATSDPQLIETGGPNGQPYIELDGTDDKLERTTNIQGFPIDDEGRSVFLVTRYNTLPNPGTTGFVYGTDNDGAAFGLIADGESKNLGITGGGTTNFNTNAQGESAGWLIHSAILDDLGNLRQFKNGTLLQTDNPNLDTDLGSILIGKDLGGNEFAAMDIAAVLVYNKALSEVERGQVETFLQHKYLGTGNGCIEITAKAFIQGAFDSGAGLMRDDLRAGNLVPTIEPYVQLGFSHLGGGFETINSSLFSLTGDKAIVDWVFLELRDPADLTSVLATRSALLLKDGSIVDLDGVSPVRFRDITPGDYHVAVKHRNHLGVLSALPVSISRTSGN